MNDAKVPRWIFNKPAEFKKLKSGWWIIILDGNVHLSTRFSSREGAEESLQEIRDRA